MKLFLHVHTRDRNYKPVMLRMRDAWEESKHPRGQPNNAGQFASGGGSSAKSQPVFRRMTPREEETTTKEEPKQTETHPEFHGLKVPKSFDLYFESSDINYYKDKSGNNLEITIINGTTFWDITDNKGMRLASGKDQEGLDKAIEKHSKPQKPSVKIPANVKVTTKAKTKTTFSGKDKEENAVGYAIDDDIRGRLYLLISEESDSWKVVRPGQTLGQYGEGQESLNQALSSSSPAKAIPKPETGSQADLAASDLSKIRVEEAITKYNKSQHNPENKTEAYYAIGRAVFDYMGIDKSVGFKVNRPYEFTVAGHKYMTGGWYSPIDNAVTICSQNDPTNNLDGLISHEAMHAKFQAVRNAYNKESDRIHEAAKDDSDKIDLIMKPNGQIREDYKKEFPIHAVMPGGIEHNVDKLMKDDGITDYSRSYWEGVNNGTNEIETAINETLAEMAKLDREGSLPRLLWYKNSKSYKPLYNNIHKLYPAAVEMLKNDKTRDD